MVAPQEVTIVRPSAGAGDLAGEDEVPVRVVEPAGDRLGQRVGGALEEQGERPADRHRSLGAALLLDELEVFALLIRVADGALNGVDNVLGLDGQQIVCTLLGQDAILEGLHVVRDMGLVEDPVELGHRHIDDLPAEQRQLRVLALEGVSGALELCAVGQLDQGEFRVRAEGGDRVGEGEVEHLIDGRRHLLAGGVDDDLLGGDADQLALDGLVLERDQLDSALGCRGEHEEKHRQKADGRHGRPH